jgi:hypothetical protein
MVTKVALEAMTWIAKKKTEVLDEMVKETSK